MLLNMHINNIALIDDIDIGFDEGLNILTGETGAGKSILLGAIGLLLGQRADVKSIKNDAQRCLIEAEFNLSQYNISDFFIWCCRFFEIKIEIIFSTGRSKGNLYLSLYLFDL